MHVSLGFEPFFTSVCLLFLQFADFPKIAALPQSGQVLHKLNCHGWFLVFSIAKEIRIRKSADFKTFGIVVVFVTHWQRDN